VPSRDILKMLRDEQGLAIDPIAVAKEKELAYLSTAIAAINVLLVIVLWNLNRQQNAAP